ncbi:MAG TPA: hypothetical protein VIJ55_01345 [Acetobacteraceae bacterium]
MPSWHGQQGTMAGDDAVTPCYPLDQDRFVKPNSGIDAAICATCALECVHALRDEPDVEGLPHHGCLAPILAVPGKVSRPESGHSFRLPVCCLTEIDGRPRIRLRAAGYLRT